MNYLFNRSERVRESVLEVLPPRSYPMSREIAGAIVEDELKELRALSYRELAERVSAVRSDGRAGPDGNEYQGEPRSAGTARPAAIFA